MSRIVEINANHQAYFRSGITRDLAFRSEALKKLDTVLHKYEKEIYNALKLDLNKSEFESYETELGLVYGELKEVSRNLVKWSKVRKVRTPLVHFPSRSFIYPEPYGTVLIMSPWNYPLQLTMIPLIGAIAAGNCIVLKPSEYSFYTAEIIEKMIREVFEERYISVIRGGRAANQSLLEQKFDFIFFTGSPTVGHFVMESAAKYLTPIILELGGKSPCIVDKTADIKLAAKRIAWGKLLNAGQTCIAPDYFFLQKDIKDEFVAELKKWIIKFYGERPELNFDYPKIINEKHFNRLKKLMVDGTIVFGGAINEPTRQIAPTIIDDVTADLPIMQEEIFGPLFPLLTYEKIEEVYDYVLAHHKPLALYLFAHDRELIDKTLATLSFGGGCINDTITHIANPHLPFGGIGESGMGHYHGKLTFDAFTHEKAVLEKYKLDIYLRYPPFKNHLPLLKKFL